MLDRPSAEPPGVAGDRGGAVKFVNFAEGAGMAVAAIRSQKLRSALTILGIIIGVATVMAMASIVHGIRSQIFNTLEVVGPTTFRILRFFSSTPLNPDALPREVRIRPVLRRREADAIERLPEIHYSSIWVGVFERLEYEGVRSQLTVVYGADERFMEVLGGAIISGRTFTPTEVRTGTGVVILEREAAEKVFGQVNPLRRVMRVGGRAFRVIGLYRKPENIFQPPGQEISAIVPFEAARHAFRYDETQSLLILVKPRDGVTVDAAMDAATLQLRRMRGLRPGDPNTFDMITSDQILNVFNQLTGVFFLVMIVLSSVALMVGGIGVMAIMMVSVTSRTREIGVRKAMGATRREILWQFLIESATLTFAGGAVGIAVGLGAGQVLNGVLRFDTGVPIWSAVVATGISIGIGLVFGLLPANRAARLDPVEALRYE
ncbi:MAG: FtsX-like permease family protein [Gemmatimonadales bacterium]|nr:FtsX-like permease family protein [Gemmatimonadales bacterium]NIN11293.1 FtsX-like permease family protein [Gemmatimonadales bacterium]NIN49892.1 FtsX-like permease family protein [Gemmatimonadales bacterium]NIP07356.1 FtsX-like permease family protein [Gemmatimonadales bacterium]NIR03051.1 FtsX-like permease family protein [Gemmatimonadales bacterium]